EEREHDVKLTKPFYMSQFQLTQEQYEMVMKSNPVKDHNDYDPRHAYLPDHLCAVGPTHPVTFVSWVDAQEFAERMTLKDRYHYRL
ncbi:formylglycine-generating enzyme family protein, partial [Staphylococcus aureus]